MAAPIPPDSISILTEFLTEDDGPGGLYALAGDRIWHPVVRASFRNAEPAIVLNTDTEVAEAPVAIATLDSGFVAKCYGGDTTQYSAKALALRFHGRINRARGRVDSGRILRARMINMQQGPPDPDHSWPCHLCFFQAIVHA